MTIPARENQRQEKEGLIKAVSPFSFWDGGLGGTFGCCDLFASLDLQDPCSKCNKVPTPEEFLKNE
jgi:hypothetical protein